MVLLICMIPWFLADTVLSMVKNVLSPGEEAYVDGHSIWSSHTLVFLSHWVLIRVNIAHCLHSVFQNIDAIVDRVQI